MPQCIQCDGAQNPKVVTVLIGGRSYEKEVSESILVRVWWRVMNQKYKGVEDSKTLVLTCQFAK